MITKTLTIIAFVFAGFSLSAQNDVKDKFIATLNGTESAAERAITTYCTQEIIENGMIPMGMAPKINRKDENCYYFQLSEDDEINHYIICSEGDKIVLFEWDLDKMDEEDEEEEE